MDDDWHINCMTKPNHAELDTDVTSLGVPIPLNLAIIVDSPLIVPSPIS